MLMIPTPIKAAVTSGIGWLNGMASQVSLPNMLALRSWRYVQIGPPGLRARSRWQFLRDDLLEKSGIGRTECERRGLHALLGQDSVALGVEGGARVARGFDPGGELVRRQCEHFEMHVRKTIATIVARLTAERARRVRTQVQLRPHAVHRVDHTAELRNEEDVHHARRGQREVERHAGRNHKPVHTRDTLAGINK